MDSRFEEQELYYIEAVWGNSVSYRECCIMNYGLYVGLMLLG